MTADDGGCSEFPYVCRSRKVGFFQMSWQWTVWTAVRLVHDFFWTSPSEHCRRTDCQDSVQSSPRLQDGRTDYVEHCNHQTDAIRVGPAPSLQNSNLGCPCILRRRGLAFHFGAHNCDELVGCMGRQPQVPLKPWLPLVKLRLYAINKMTPPPHLGCPFAICISHRPAAANWSNACRGCGASPNPCYSLGPKGDFL